MPARVMIAVTSVLAGSLALGASAATAATPAKAKVKAAPGMQIPLDPSNSSAYPGFGPAVGLSQFFQSEADNFTVVAANLLAQAGDKAALQIPDSVHQPQPWNATSNPWTIANLQDFNYWASENGGTSGDVQAAADFLDTGEGTAPIPTGNYVKKLRAIDPTYSADATQLRNVYNLYIDEAYLSIPALLPGARAAYPGGLYTVNGDMSVSSRATVTNRHKPAAYSLTVGVSGRTAAKSTAGYVDPSGETVTFPRGWVMNLAVLKDEIPYADIDDPSASGKKPIGTLVIHSPDIGLLNENAQSTSADGQVYLVRSAKASQLLPRLELFIATKSGTKVVVMARLSGTTFPLKVTFQTPLVGTTLANSLDKATPFSSLQVSFPAKTSPYIIPSCRAAASPVATVTDNLASVTPYFGDYADGNTIGLPVAPAPVRIASTRTKVTDHCKR